MKWTTQLPTEPGYYWFYDPTGQARLGTEIQIVKYLPGQYSYTLDKLMVDRLDFIGDEMGICDTPTFFSIVHPYFSGPIEPPDFGGSNG